MSIINLIDEDQDSMMYRNLIEDALSDFRCGWANIAPTHENKQFMQQDLSQITKGLTQGYEYVLVWTGERSYFIKQIKTEYLKMQNLNIAMDEVVSSNVEKVGYNTEHQTLAVQFKGKDKPALYYYANVPEEIFLHVKDAKSIGGFIRENVIGKFATTKIS